MIPFRKVVALFIVLPLSLFSLPIAFAVEPETFTQTANGPVPVISATDASTVNVEAQITPASEASTTEFLAGDDNPLSQTEDTTVEIESNDPFYGTTGSWGQSYDDLWWLKRVKADQAWSFTKGAGVTVAVIDTGLDYNHEDIASNVWYNQAELNGLPGVDDDGNGYVDDIKGWDFQNNDNDPLDDNGHGTHVAGIIGAVADNLKGIAGVAPESKILSVKVLGASGSGTIQNVINGIYYAANMGANIINMSLGALKSAIPLSLRTAWENALAYARGKGVIPVAAAGNSNTNVNKYYPSGISTVTAVGATDPNNNRAWFSNYGNSLDFMAPGVDILSLRASGTNFGSDSGNPNYSRASGTSMASPIAAGVAALLKSWQPTLTYNDIYNRLKKSAVDLGAAGFDIYYGYGLVNAYKAITLGSTTSLASTSTVSSSTGSASGTTLAQSIDFISEKPNLTPVIPLPIGDWYIISALRHPKNSESSNSKRKKNFSPFSSISES